MGREEARTKSWNTFRENMKKYAEENPDFSLRDFIMQRTNTSYVSWRQARNLERKQDYVNARAFYLKAVESLEQAEKIIDYPGGIPYVTMLKDEYLNFVIHRDPYYRNTIKYVLPVIKGEPGILQTETYKRFNADKSELSYALYFAEKEGLIRREKKGRSYLLFFLREKPADEPLLSIQDDDVDIQEKVENAKQAEKTKKGCLVAFLCFIWIFFFVFAITMAGPFGAGVIAVSFVVWRIVIKIRQKKQRQAASSAETTDNEIQKT